MTFLNPLSIFFWLIPIIPTIIFLINRRNHKLVKFSSIKFLTNLKSDKINKIKLINILLLIIRTMILIIILLIIMRPQLENVYFETSNKKIINRILIDDSFSNKYGTIDNHNRIFMINQIMGTICDNYPLDSKLKISTLNKGVIFDGFNQHDLEFSKINSRRYQFNSFDGLLLDASYKDYNKNIHFISNLNARSINRINDIDKKINQDKNIVFYHYLPESLNNQYIKEVKFIENIDGLFYYKIIIGNDYNQTAYLDLSIYKNLYDYNSYLHINQTIPLFNKKVQIEANSSFVDTISISLDTHRFSEILFKLENEKRQDWFDVRLEDNHYSYVMDIPDNINVSIFYDDLNNKEYITPILDAFKILTNNIDSNFFNIHYYSTVANKYSNIFDNQDILIFLGYDTFLKSSQVVLSDFFKNHYSQIILFPTKNDIYQDYYKFNINDSILVENLYHQNILNGYDTIKFSDSVKLSDYFINNDFKLFSYFYHSPHKNSKFKIDNEKSIWSRYSINNGYLDLFGFLINYQNNFFNSQSIFPVPFLYSIMIDERINSFKNNLELNKKFKGLTIRQDKLKLVNINGDSIIFHASEYPIISSRGIFGLIKDEKLNSLYSFNPIKENFNNNSNLSFIKRNITNNIIEYSNKDDVKFNFMNILQTNEITKYFIYFLIFLLLLEMFFSNARSSKSN